MPGIACVFQFVILRNHIVVNGDVASPEIPGDHTGHSVPVRDVVSVAISGHYVDVVYNRRIGDDDRSVRSIPRVIDLARCERHPADIGSPSEKHDKRRTPVMADLRFTGIPDPSVRCSVIPPAIVVRSPAPGIAADPGPAVEIHPDPSANTIGGPIDSDIRGPYPTIRWIVDPSAITVQSVGAIDMAIDVFVAVAAIVIPVT